MQSIRLTRLSYSHFIHEVSQFFGLKYLASVDLQQAKGVNNNRHLISVIIKLHVSTGVRVRNLSENNDLTNYSNITHVIKTSRILSSSTSPFNLPLLETFRWHWYFYCFPVCHPALRLQNLCHIYPMAFVKTAFVTGATITSLPRSVLGELAYRSRQISVFRRIS